MAVEIKDFIMFLEKDDDGNTLIGDVISYHPKIYEEIQKTSRPDTYMFIDMVNDYTKGERLDWYDEEGYRLTDYEIWLKFGILLLPEGSKFNEHGAIVFKTDDEKFIDGEIEKPGYEVYNGKIRPIPYKDLKDQFEKEDKTDFINHLKSSIDQVKKSEFVINHNGIIVTINESDKDTLQDMVNAEVAISWRADDDKFYSLSADDAKAIIKSYIESSQKQFKEVTAYKDNIVKMVNEGVKTFDEIINYVESITKDTLDIQSKTYTQEPENKQTIENQNAVPDQNPYSGIIPQTEIKELKKKRKKEGVVKQMQWTDEGKLAQI